MLSETVSPNVLTPGAVPAKRIRHPTDFSAGSDGAWRYTCAVARDYDARLYVPYALERVVPLVGDCGPRDAEQRKLVDMNPSARVARSCREGREAGPAAAGV